MKTRFVLDRNFSILPDLTEYFESGNEIVLTDDFLVEAYRSLYPNDILDENFKIMRNYKDQILMTFSRVELFRMEISLRKPVEPHQFISSEATSKIRWLLGLEKDALDKELLSLKSIAADHIAYQTDFTEVYIRNAALEALELLRGKNMIETYRTNRNKRMDDFKDFSFQLVEKVLKENNCSECELEPFRHRISVIFSQTFIHLWRVVHWALKDGFQNATKSIRGDGFDIKYVLASCFFDGILTKDKWLIECREDTMSSFVPQSQSASMP